MWRANLLLNYDMSRLFIAVVEYKCIVFYLANSITSSIPLKKALDAATEFTVVLLFLIMYLIVTPIENSVQI
jgi:hypothetical protein